MSAIEIFHQPRSICSCKSCGSAYPSRAGTEERMSGRASVLTQSLHEFSLKGGCSVPAPSRLGRNTPYARCLMVTDNWNPHWLGNENHCGRRGVWACGGCATRHHGSVCCRLDAGSGDPHHNILVQLYRVYHLGGGRIAAACAFLCETPKRHGGSKAPCSTLACSRRGAANSIFSGSKFLRHPLGKVGGMACRVVHISRKSASAVTQNRPMMVT